MPRKQFIADVAAASQLSITGLSDVARGTDDESVYATYTPVSGPPLEIELLVQPDLGSYPSESFCMVFSRSTVVPDGVGSVLQGLQDDSHGLMITEVLNNLSQKLQRHYETGTANEPYTIEDSDLDPMDLDESGGNDEEEDEESEEDYYGDSDHDDFNIGGIQGSNVVGNATFKLTPETAVKINRRIKDDLRTCRFAGFKIGILIGMKADSVHSLLSLAVQVTKLGLSDEAMQAWDLEPQQYVVFLMRYSNGYKSFDTIIEEGANSLDVTFRVGISNKYKPTVTEALAAFSETKMDLKSSQRADESETTPEGKPVAGFSSMFISSSLEELVNKRFMSLLKIRFNVGVGWDGAKMYYSDKEGRMDFTAELPSTYYEESPAHNTTLPDIVTSDHLSENMPKGQFSFPLIAMQFILRYLTRCTEFCLVCHDKMKENFEALKPYVCEKPLCLYQYMNLGFGPSVEHEIMTQPWVVDLLVSFCYTSAMFRRLRDYPVGMSLAVPPVVVFTTSASHAGYGRAVLPLPPVKAPGSVVDKANDVPTEFIVKYDADRQEVIFEAGISPVRTGDWVILTTVTVPLHFKIEDVSCYPIVKLSENPVIRNTVATPAYSTTPATPYTPSVTPPPFSSVVARMVVYNQNFDDMDDIGKAETIGMLIETLPSIRDIKEFLIQQSRTSQPNLRKWNERISPAALGMLRWIIASNRSCIVQVDRCPGQDDIELVASKVRLEQRISNISQDWVQFRFAQGSPDKEQRFLNALREEQANLNTEHPTLFAFHGSPLQNWHSIIRTGLDFKETLHGRAYGHGVYHAKDQQTSIGYAQPAQVVWQASDLQITSAVSLNEIVNCPSKFQSISPYLVVQHVDWIQCRYLLVQARGSVNVNVQSAYTSNNSRQASRDPDPSNEVKQDPSYPAVSTLTKAIGVPLCATSVSRAFRKDAVKENSTKKRKSGAGSSSSRQSFDTPQVQSDSEDPEDYMFLISDDESKGKGKASQTTSQVPTKPMTDFVPGSLDQASLPMLSEPEYATPGATKSLNRALQEILAVQKNTPLHEIGWYIDVDLISNVYQWIVELHSFDADLPLAKDMKAAGFTSVVMEIRFPKDYPFAPPFLRVIRPRFLPFTQGGGGHVTAGGAMCMELLTNSGWSSVSSIEGILLQVRLAISNLEPRPARLEGQGQKQNKQDYATGEAMAAYIRACQTHGWIVPEGFKDFASGENTGFY